MMEYGFPRVFCTSVYIFADVKNSLRQFFDIMSFSIAFLISLDFLLLELIGPSYLLASVLYLQLKMFYNIFQVVGLLLLTDSTII